MLTHLLEAMLRNRGRSVVVLLLVSALALVAAWSLELNPRWTKALPRKDPLIAEYLRVVNDPLRGSTVYAVVDGPGPLEGARRFAELAASLPHVRYVHGADAEVLPYELMFLTRAQLRDLIEIARRLDLGDLVTDYAARMEDGETAAASDGPGDFRSHALPLLESLAAALEGRNATGPEEIVASAFRSPPGIPSVDDDARLLRIETDFSEQSIEDLPPFVEALRGLAEMVERESPNPRIRLTGYPVTACDEMQRIASSGKFLTLGAVVLVVVMLRLFLGGARSVLCSITILLVCLLWILGLIRVAFGEMNTVTMIMGLVLVGLGIDFCIHWLNHFRRGQDRGLEGLPLARFVLRKAATPILAGATTTAGAFLCLLLLDVPSLREFAWLSAAGVILAALLVLLVMPLLMAGSPPDRRPGPRVTRGIVARSRSALAHPGRVLVVSAGMLLVAGWSLRSLGYEYNYSRLQIGGLPSHRLKDEIIYRFGISSDILVQRVAGLEEAAASARELSSRPQIAHVESVTDYLLPREEQRARAELIAALGDTLARTEPRRYEMQGLFEISRGLFRRRKEARSLIRGARARLEFDQYSTVLERIVGALDPETLDVLNDFNRQILEAFRQQIARRSEPREIAFADLPEPVKAAFETSTPGVYLQYVFPAGNLWEKEPAEAMERALAGVTPPPVGLSRIAAHLKRALLGQGVQMIVAAALVVLLALRISLRSWPLAVLAAVPVTCGTVLTAATLSLLGIKINFYNLVGIPIILGIGIDDGVHLVNAYRTHEERDPLAAVHETGAAILLTSLTSMIGFGCLAFYRHPGMSTLGVVLFIGVGWCLITSLIQLPVLLQWHASGRPRVVTSRSRDTGAGSSLPAGRESYD